MLQPYTKEGIIGAKHRRGLVALSADPVTFGHLDLIAKAAAKCHELVVLVANNDRKLGSYCFTLDKRTAMVRRAVDEAGLTNVRVIGSSGLLVDVYLREGCDRLFRGVRNEKDVDFEEEQATLNCMILPAIEGRFEFVQADPKLKLVSSTLVKAFVQLRLDVDKFVPMFVKQALEEKLLQQYRVTVTGGIAVGKSFVAAELAAQAARAGIPSKHVNVDQLLRDVYDEQSEGAQEVREALAAYFDDTVLTSDRKAVQRPRLADILFRSGADEHRKFVTDLTMPHVARKYREALADATGLVVVEWAQMAEMDMGSWTNNNAIVVHCPDRATFLAKRGVSPERMAVMDEIQWREPHKMRILYERAKRDRSGCVLAYLNQIRETEEAAKFDVATFLLSKVMTLFPDILSLRKE
jgi:pantetheine-phosphate adenylyltransferase